MHTAIKPKAKPESSAAPKTWHCAICGFIYDETAGFSQEGIPAGTRWEDVPADWECPECGGTKVNFDMAQI